MKPWVNKFRPNETTSKKKDPFPIFQVGASRIAVNGELKPM